jgi:flagellar basal body-associated protein FliL
MEPLSADDRPYLRERESSLAWWVVAAAFVILGSAAAAYYYSQQKTQTKAAAVPATSPAAPAQQAADAAIRHPLDAKGGDAALPGLDNSDAMMRDALAGLLGRKSFDELVYPAQLVRRIVATVDNLPRETAPRRVMPVQPVPGAFSALPAGDEATIAPDNSARYAPYVRVFESLDSRALVQGYIRAYPLFPRAYEELGYPNRYFNDRLVQAIDDMLAAPELSAPVHLIRPKVLYQYADPDLETRSAGQKIVIRMGSENAAKVKAKLREIRAQLSRS